MKKNVPDQALSLAEFVRLRRRVNRLTQAQLAELAGVGRRLVVDIEGGKPTLRMDVVNAVLSVFGKTLGPIDAPREIPVEDG
jgi:y4mF family transcriptional regulator